MGDGLASTASGLDHDASSSNHLYPPRSPLPPPLSPSRDLRLDQDITKVDLTRTNDLLSSSYIDPAPSPRASHVDEPIIASDGHEVRPALSTVAEKSLLPSVRTARRLQRQLNAQLRITRSQLESISGQVEEMIASEDQCKLPTPLTPSTPASEGLVDVDEMQGLDTCPDEGFYDGGEDEEEMAVERLRLTFRKAADHRGIRKNVGGQDLLFARPRMRKKIVRRKRPEPRPAV